jgi:alpha,alpha-trehalose phosphorylase
MIAHPAFSVEPWSLRETELDLDVLDQAGSVFALANGHIDGTSPCTTAPPAGCDVPCDASLAS